VELEYYKIAIMNEVFVIRGFIETPNKKKRFQDRVKNTIHVIPRSEATRNLSY